MNFFGAFSQLFNRGRKLKPVIKERPSKNLEMVKECKLVVHVIKAVNVPIRHDLLEEYENMKEVDLGQNQNPRGVHQPTPNLPDRAGNPDYDRQEAIEDNRQDRRYKSRKELDNTPQVETYVEVKIVYHEKYSIVKTTFTDEGSMPRWNQILDFPISSGSSEGFTTKELSSSKTMIIASLFDKQTYVSEREGKRVLQEEHRFLGAVHVPL